MSIKCIVVVLYVDMFLLGKNTSPGVNPHKVSVLILSYSVRNNVSHNKNLLLTIQRYDNSPDVKASKYRQTICATFTSVKL